MKLMNVNCLRAGFVTTAIAAIALAAVATADERPVVVRWDFEAEETTPLTSHGGVHRDVPGPRPPEFPDLDVANTAVRLDGNGAHLSFDDDGADSPFDFTNGQSITLEAWVQVDNLRSGENAYIIGKGRTGAAGFPADNQNWALRVREQKGKACVSFLFATKPASGKAKSDAHWHRWTTNDGFTPSKQWHHVAATYRFGEPESVRGWIDGKPQPGAWDMGGTTKEPPVVDDDAVWIGSSQRGNPGNSFRGGLDAIAIHRQSLDDAAMKSRFRREGAEIVEKPAPETMPDLGPLPRGRVLGILHEGFPAHDRWLNNGEPFPPEMTRVPFEAFLLDRLPQRYDAWGIRENWKPTTLLRLAADVQLEPGQRTFLLRVRGLSRLWVNGTLVAKTKPITGSPSGEEPMTPVAAPPLAGLRPAEHRQQEMTGTADINATGTARVVVETLIGGKAFRADPGELCVAVQSPDGQSYHVLQATGSSGPPIALTDADVTAALARSEKELRAFDDQTRRTAAASQDEFWNKRHAIAREWVKDHSAPAVPSGSKHPVEAFLAAKIATAVAASNSRSAEQARQFHAQVLPILRDQCFRCHGEKEKGGLRLNSREAALKGGDSETPAIVPGDAAASPLIRRLRATEDDERMPPNGDGLPAEQIAILEAWVNSGAAWPAPPVTAEQVAAAPLVDDSSFLRRVFLDSVGVPPTERDVREFLAARSLDKRDRVIDRQLDDPRWADHWMSYWQDVLAENPTLINSSLNTTGPFRWFLYEALRDDKPFDRLVTELMLLRGSPSEGGSAGFALAGDNDAPFAAKAQIVAQAFLGIELQCARCHDSPYHSTRQRDLYSLAAMLERKPVSVPKTSRVPDAFFDKKSRESLIKVTLKPAESVAPAWPFAEVTGCADDAALKALLQSPDDSRERLAALVTAPQNTRFAQVVVNRVWRRLMGAGLVEPAHDWEGRGASHPELLDWLAREFVGHDYNLKHIARLILTSPTYQRAATGDNLAASPELRFFIAPERRRLTAEQVVDSLVVVSGQAMEVEELTFDPDGRRPSSNRITLGRPERAWMLANLANERDRPSLNLPRARVLVDVLEAFGWSGARQNPRTDRETSPNVLQPGVLANSVASVWYTRAAEGSGLAELALQAQSPAALVDSIFLRTLGRPPSDAEREPFAAALTSGFENRILSASQVQPPAPLERLSRVTWSNHLRPESTTIMMELERRARSGPNPDPRLRTEWREVFEDVVWSVVNTREFVWMP